VILSAIRVFHEHVYSAAITYANSIQLIQRPEATRRWFHQRIGSRPQSLPSTVTRPSRRQKCHGTSATLQNPYKLFMTSWASSRYR